MKPARKLTVPIAGLFIAAALFYGFRKFSPPVPNETAASSVTEMASKHRQHEGSRASVRSQVEPTEGEVILMTPADWETVFKNRYLDLDEEFKEEIVMLAGELEEMIRNGAKPDEEEPRVFAQTILVLLHEKQETGR